LTQKENGSKEEVKVVQREQGSIIASIDIQDSIETRNTKIEMNEHQKCFKSLLKSQIKNKLKT